jgi:hypothetical protein
MGRKKYTMKQDINAGNMLIPQMAREKKNPYGRNMLIGEYLWIAYCQSLPPGVQPDESMWRQRKQVSSHVQVLKGFFQHHISCKFFWGLQTFTWQQTAQLTTALLWHPCSPLLLPQGEKGGQRQGQRRDTGSIAKTASRADCLVGGPSSR